MRTRPKMYHAYNDYLSRISYKKNSREPMKYAHPTVYDFDFLCKMMKARIAVTIYTTTNLGPTGVEGIINGIRPEDGSGNHWLVTILDRSTLKAKEVYVRTA